ncbi:MAG TPA: Uma2 family endonuclease [Kofleriaceae bacterium]|nr:Uma2 family endonuclease [Kofleriaceae bacterium]
MSTAKRLHYDYADYLRSLELSDLKLEYCDGVIYAMAGGTPAHAQLSAAIIVALHRVLPRTCRVATSDMKVRIEASDLSTFPDASVICGELRVSSLDSNAVTNPTLLIEVTSRSTEDYDRGDKLSHYKQLPSLRAVLLVSHRSRVITLVQRTAHGWEERAFRSGELVSLEMPTITFAVDEIYEGIRLDSEA